MRIPGFLAAPLLVAALFGVSTPAAAALLIQIDKSAQRMSVAVDGEQRHVWPVSTGRAGYITPTGSFTPFRMEEDHYSKEWDDAPMPHSVFFTRDGHAIHGSFEVKRLGTAASHGCVRLAPENAAKLFALVKAQGLPNTKVVISGAEPPPAVARRNPARETVREPTPLQGENYGTRTRPSDDGVRVSPEPYAERRELDTYAARMRQRYYNERVAPRHDERMPTREVYQAPPSYYQGGYYQGGGYPYGNYGYRY